ncbi:MAG: sugar ABC transporter permease [Clostridia bacterium]|nr:sugar ABC transporter permease [Clostridia bacterium]
MKKLHVSMATKRAVNGYLFILPWFIGFALFYVRSLFMTVQFSLNELTVPASGGYELDFVGLGNYITAFTGHGTFKQTLTTSLGNMLIDVPLIIFFSLFVAMLLNRKMKCRGLVRAIFFLPVLMNSEAVSGALEYAAQMMAGGLSGMSAEMAEASASGSAVNMTYFIQLFGELAIPQTVLDYIVGAVSRISDIIQASGVQIVLFIAALQSITPSMYEVAKIEGATGYETFWKVTFPMVMPHIITNTIYTIVDAFSQSEVVNLAYTTAFTESNYGLSSAFSVISTVITCSLLAVVVYFISKRTFYYN